VYQVVFVIPSLENMALTYVSKLKYDENPDYNKLRNIFRGGISGKDEWKLDLPLSIASLTSQVC
jgi:hypothetical protein